MTAVGHSVDHSPLPEGVDPFSRYGRLLRATARFESRHPGVKGAYKDLDTILGFVPN